MSVRRGDRISAPGSLARVRGKTIATAADLYLNDFDDQYPRFTFADEIAGKVSPCFPKARYSEYGGTHLTYRGEAATYIWNSELYGYKVSEDTNPLSWMFYDPEEFNGLKMLANMDTSVRGLNADELTKALAVKLTGFR